MRAIFVPLALVALIGCSHEEAPPKTVVTTPTTTAANNNNKGTDPAVNLSQDIMTACKIEVTQTPPKFDFDQSNLSSAERDILQKVATCLTTGPLAGRNVKLVGRADPRGEQEYNMNLGEHRATSVRKYLMGLGVAGNRMTETSRGALDATGHDESGWENDRRVDIALN